MPKAPKPPPTVPAAPNRFVGTADDVTPVGRIVRTIDNTSPEDRANREMARRLLDEARKTK